MTKAVFSLASQLLGVSQALVHMGLNKGTSGNVSVRNQAGLLITPSGMTVDKLQPDHMVPMQMDGSYPTYQKPSSEWPFHRDILQNRPEVNAVIHTHSMFATTIACLRRDVPPFHYMIAVAGGDTIRCAPYALFGTQELSDNALHALQYRKACLLANHGMIALGRNLDEALAVAVEVENLCEHYWRLLQLGDPPLLTKQEMAEVFTQFEGYGRWARQ